MRLLPPAAVRAAFNHPHRRIFRLETLQAYAAPDEAAILAAFRAGRPRPPDPGKDEYTAMVRDGRRHGTIFQRVHVCREPLSEYLQYELTWSYAASAAAGEEIRIVPLAAAEPWPGEVPQLDFWLFDDQELYVLRYTPAGRWCGVERSGVPEDLAVAARWRSAALALGQPWLAYVAARPELVSHLQAVS